MEAAVIRTISVAASRDQEPGTMIKRLRASQLKPVRVPRMPFVQVALTRHRTRPASSWFAGVAAGVAEGGASTVISGIFCVLIGIVVNAAVSVSVDAAPTRTWVNADANTQRYCIRHRHGDRWHSCSDTRHPVLDQSHSHTGLPAYYASAVRYRSSGFYFGVKSGAMEVDIEQSEGGLPKGILMGFGRGEYALEIEASSTSITSTSTAFTNTAARPVFDSSYATRALYGVRRIGEGFYTKMKVGLSQSQYKINGERHKDSNGSAGLGFGLRFGTVLLESEYTFVGSKATFFSVGASIVF